MEEIWYRGKSLAVAPLALKALLAFLAGDLAEALVLGAEPDVTGGAVLGPVPVQVGAGRFRLGRKLAVEGMFGVLRHHISILGHFTAQGIATLFRLDESHLHAGQGPLQRLGILLGKAAAGCLKQGLEAVDGQT